MARSFASGIHPDALKRAGVDTTPARTSKYGNTPTEYGGRTYDSALEARAAAHLDVMQLAGLVTAWKAQPAFDLGAGVTYRADFAVQYATGAARIIDMKGHETAEFKLKRKFFEALYGPLDVLKRVEDIPTTGRESTHDILDARSDRYAGRKP